MVNWRWYCSASLLTTSVVCCCISCLFCLSVLFKRVCFYCAVLLIDCWRRKCNLPGVLVQLSSAFMLLSLFRVLMFVADSQFQTHFFLLPLLLLLVALSYQRQLPPLAVSICCSASLSARCTPSILRGYVVMNVCGFLSSLCFLLLSSFYRFSIPSRSLGHHRRSPR